MLRTLDGVTGVLVVLVLAVGVTCLAALALALRRIPLRALALRRTPQRPRLLTIAQRRILQRPPSPTLAADADDSAQPHTAKQPLGPLALRRTPRRTPLLALPLRRIPRHAAAAVLVAAVGLATAAATVAASAEQSVDDAFDAMPADLIVRDDGPIDPATLDAIRAIRSVDLAASGATSPATVDGRRATVSTWDDNGAANLLLAHRPTAGTIETLAAGQVLMSEQTANRFGAHVGDPVTVRLPGTEPRELRLVGIFADSPVDTGIVLSWSDWPTPSPTTMLVKLAPGTPPDDVTRQLTDNPDISILTPTHAAQDLHRPIDRLTLPIWVLLAAAMCLSVPAAPSKAVLSTATGVAGGVPFGATLTWALAARGITDLAVPWPQLAACIIAAALLAALSAIRPTPRETPSPAHDPVAS